MVATSAITTTPTATSARCGTAYFGCTADKAAGRWWSRAIAMVVRETPRISDSKEPRAATAAPIPTIGASPESEPASTATRSGALAAANVSGPTASRTDNATTR